MNYSIAKLNAANPRPRGNTSKARRRLVVLRRGGTSAFTLGAETGTPPARVYTKNTSNLDVRSLGLFAHSEVTPIFMKNLPTPTTQTSTCSRTPMKRPVFTIICRRLGLAALTATSLALALPAFAGSFTAITGPTYNPSTAFAGSTITVQTTPSGDVVRLTGNTTITPPSFGLGGSDSISFTANFTANPGDRAALAYSFTVNSTDPRNFDYRVSGTATIGGVPQTYTSEGTITPGTHTYAASAMAPAPFLTTASGSFTGQLLIIPITQLPRGGSPSGGATGTLAVSITQGDFSLTGGTPPPVTAAHLRNISSRAMVMGGDQDAIAGFIITGNVPKRVIVRGIGPSLPSYVPTKLSDPSINLLHLVGDHVDLVGMNNDWKSDQQVEIMATGLAPTDDHESAIVATLDPGNYTTQLSGNGSSGGIGLIEVYDLDPEGVAMIGNLSTRAMALKNDNVLIGGVIVGGTITGRIVVRAIGPSMTQVPGILADPTLDLYNGNGMAIASNDDWQQDANANQLGSLAPSDSKESALARDLAPGQYTAIVRGKGTATGIALVEFYLVQPVN